MDCILGIETTELSLSFALVCKNTHSIHFRQDSSACLHALINSLFTPLSLVVYSQALPYRDCSLSLCIDAADIDNDDDDDWHRIVIRLCYVQVILVSSSSLFFISFFFSILIQRRRRFFPCTLTYLVFVGCCAAFSVCVLVHTSGLRKYI